MRYLRLSLWLWLIGRLASAAPGAVSERLEYDLYWSLLPVGQLVIETGRRDVEGLPRQYVRLTVESNRLIGKLFPVRDVVESVQDADTGRPVHLSKRTREGRVVCEDDLYFDAARGMARWENHRAGSVVEYPVPENAHDAVSLMTAMRDESLAAGQERRIPVAVDGRLYEVIVRAQREEAVDLGPLGRRPALRVSISTSQPGMFVRKAPRALWISTEPPVRALQMLVKAPLGTVRVVLRSITHSKG